MVGSVLSLPILENFPGLPSSWKSLSLPTLRILAVTTPAPNPGHLDFLISLFLVYDGETKDEGREGRELGI